MPRGDKSSYTDKQKRQARHIEEGYEGRGVGEGEAERRAWATVNAETHGGKKSGSGRGRSENHEPSRKGGRLGGSSQSHSERSRFRLMHSANLEERSSVVFLRPSMDYQH